MKTKIILCALAAILTVSACDKQDTSLFKTDTYAAFKPGSMTLTADGQWHEFTVHAGEATEYQLFLSDEAAKVVALDATYQKVTGTNTFYITAKPVKKKTTVTLSALVFPVASGSTEMKITVMP